MPPTTRPDRYTMIYRMRRAGLVVDDSRGDAYVSRRYDNFVRDENPEGHNQYSGGSGGEHEAKLGKLTTGQRAAYEAFKAAGPTGTHDRTPGRPMHEKHTAALLRHGLIKPVGTATPWAKRGSMATVPTYATVEPGSPSRSCSAGGPTARVRPASRRASAGSATSRSRIRSRLRGSRSSCRAPVASALRRSLQGACQVA